MTLETREHPVGFISRTQCLIEPTVCTCVLVCLNLSLTSELYVENTRVEVAGQIAQLIGFELLLSALSA